MVLKVTGHLKKKKKKGSMIWRGCQIGLDFWDLWVEGGWMVDNEMKVEMEDED